MSKTVVIFSINVANDLIANGFNVVLIGLSHNNDGKTVFLFENTKQIRTFLKTYHGITIK